MSKEYTKEQLWKLYENLSERLKELIFSEKAADIIWNTCQENKIPNNDVSKLSGAAGRVILGVLPLDKFQETIQAELKIKENIAKKVSLDINRLIFSQIKDDLTKTYNTEKDIKTEPEEKPKRPSSKDVYREKIE